MKEGDEFMYMQCPVCRSLNIRYEPCYYEGNFQIQTVLCIDCNSKWQDRYEYKNSVLIILRR